MTVRFLPFPLKIARRLTRLPDLGERTFAVTSASYSLHKAIAIGKPAPEPLNPRIRLDLSLGPNRAFSVKINGPGSCRAHNPGPQRCPQGPNVPNWRYLSSGSTQFNTVETIEMMMAPKSTAQMLSKLKRTSKMVRLIQAAP